MDIEMLRDRIINIDCDDYNYSTLDLYYDLKNNVDEYQSYTNDYRFEYYFDDIVDYDIAEEIAKRELNEGGLVRLYYFLGDANCNNDIFRIDGYGNLEDFTRDDVRDLKQQILDEIGDEHNE